MARKHVCVFCGSNDGGNPRFLEAALRLGVLMGNERWSLVYGGGTRGLMGAVARSAKQHGSSIISVVPQRFAGHAIFEGTDETVMTDTLQDRKRHMMERSDAFIIMPGGMGTLDEFSEVLTLRLLGLSEKPVALLNTEDFFSSLIKLMHEMIEAGFLKPACRELLIVREHPEDIIKALGS